CEPTSDASPPLAARTVPSASLPLSPHRPRASLRPPFPYTTLFRSLTDNGNLNWTLVGPAGTVVSARSFQGSDSFDFGNPVLDLVAEEHTPTVHGPDDPACPPYQDRNMDLASATPFPPATPVRGIVA